MTKSLTLSLACALAATSIASVAQTPPPPPPPEARTQAMPYVMAAGQSDMFEINSSQVALQKSQNPAVRRYAQMLIKHHQKTTAATLKAARKARLSPTPPMLDPGATASINELQTASAADFDRIYLAQQVPAHQAALDLHQAYSQGGDQAPLRMTARTAVPIVRSHLVAAQRMQGMTGDRGM
jgi:putative membrane protein